MAAEDRSLRVLIAGAGIAGVAAAISLSRVSSAVSLDVQLYEQAPEPLEIGASIALSPNGMRTLEKLGVHKALSDEVGYRGPNGIPQIFRHWKTDQVISADTYTNVPNPRHRTTRFHRGHLHAALFEHVPSRFIHLGKRLTRAEANQNGVTLHFEDGSEAHGDILIGADGICSFSGKVFMRSTFDDSLVEGKIPSLPTDSMHWWGPCDNFFASKLGKNQYTTVGAYDDPRTAEKFEKGISWDQSGDVNFLRGKYKNWNPTVRALTELTPYTNLFPNFAGDALPTWVFASRATLIGDAAHAHGGAFAAGGSLALDDALALGLAFRHVFKPSNSGQPFSLDDIRKALGLYSNTRQPHTARLLRIVHNQIEKRGVQFDSPGEEDAALVTRMRSRPNTEGLSEHDVEAAFVAALEQTGAAEAPDQSQALRSTDERADESRVTIQLKGSNL